MSDERELLPSASAVSRYSACKGSFLAGRGINTVQTKEMSEWAASGDRIHFYLEDPTFTDLEDIEELEVAESCERQRDSLLKQVFGENAKFVKVIKEDRMWLKQGRKRVFSGKPDFIAVYGDIALIVDFKTNRGDIPESPKNLQLRSLAVLLQQSMVLRQVYVAIIQPLVSKEPLLTLYERTAQRDDLGLAESELMGLLAEINQPGAPRSAGKHCRFCPANFKCPEAAALLKEFSGADVDGVSMTQLMELLNTAAAADGIIKAVKAKAKSILADNPVAIPGWTIGEAGSIRSVNDPFGAFKVLQDAKLITKEQFLTTCIKVGVGDLELAVATANNISTKEAKQKVNLICADFITSKPKEGSLTSLD